MLMCETETVCEGFNGKNGLVKSVKGVSLPITRNPRRILSRPHHIGDGTLLL